jgi:excisionase family DNA binding protein
MPETTPLLISVKQVAQLLSVSRQTVYNLHQTGTLGPLPVKLGRATRYNRNEIEDWINQGANISRRVWQARRQLK